MSISNSELIAYCAADRPLDDVSPSGGAIDPYTRAVFTELGSSSALEAVSDNAGDTQTITVTGRDAAGVYQTSTATMTGTAPVALSPATVFERVLTCALSVAATGNVTLRKVSAGATVGVVPPGEKGFSALFINSFSAGTTQTRYEKVFYKNTNGTLTLTSSTVTLSADPVGGIFTAGVAVSLDDTDTTPGGNRFSAPTGITFATFNTAQTVPYGGDGNLPAASAIGVWIKQVLSVNHSPELSTFTATLAGNTI